MIDIDCIREQFPFLSQTSHGKRLAFLDTGASAQKPLSVINMLNKYNQFEYANVHRGAYTLSQQSSDAYENTRVIVQKFINASRSDEIIFTKGTTDAINLLASSLSKALLNEEDEIIISEMEHHANIVPWQIAANNSNLRIKVWEIDNDQLCLERLERLISNKTKIIAVTQCSNVLGTINDIKAICELAHKHKIMVVVDAAQSVVHQKIDVQDLDCDFLVFSGHKLYGPTGVGVLYGKYNILDKMPPYQGGGDMIKEVSFEKTVYADPPYKFEAGTPNIVSVIALQAAIQFINDVGYEAIQMHEKKLYNYVLLSISKISDIKIIGQAKNKTGILTFIHKIHHASDLGTLLDLSGVCVRTGHHCAQPLIKKYKIDSTVRLSLGIYNNKEDIDQFITGLKKAINMLE